MTRAAARVTAIETFYGPIQAIRGVSLEVAQGQIVTVLGANGAGKTTVLRTISGVLDPERGQVRFEGQRHRPPAARSGDAAGHLPRARGPRGLPVPDGAREPADGRLHAPRQGRGASRPGTVLRLFPGAEGTLAPARRPAVGRRAADAGDQPRADGPAEAAAARRAVARPVADAGARRSSASSAASTRSRASPSCWSSRTRTSRCRPPISATCWRSAASCSRMTARG